ncbi:MAG: Gfo/Idh/MocA family oxidoreductase [Bacteroidota bacterium]
MSQSPIRWGIIAPGRIAHKFADGLSQLPDAILQAVASSNADRAQAFADQFGFAKTYTSYEDLLQDPEIDIVYIASPHPFHHQQALLCLDHGKHVLCEKPMAINYAQSAEVIEKAREKGLFFMEALWTRFLPIMQEVKKWVFEERIGEIQWLRADFGFRATFDAQNRKYNPELAGGTLLDIGIYPLNMAYLFFQEDPQETQSTASLGSTGVDEQSAITLKYSSGAIAELGASFRVESPKELHIMGSKGQIRVPLFWRSSEASLEIYGDKTETLYRPYASFGLQCQATYVMESLRQGRTEEPLMPWSESLRIMKKMDELRMNWGVRYPGE